jgi:DNA processing protein
LIGIFLIPKIRKLVYQSGYLSNTNSWEELFERFSESYPDIKANVFSKEGKEIDQLLNHYSYPILDFFHPMYPKDLKEIYDPPLVLSYQGDLNLLSILDKVAIVGTRTPSYQGRSLTSYFLSNVSSNTCIVSGLALGIDQEAMTISLNRNMPTIGVMGTEMHIEYPLANHQLYKKMKSKGLLLSETFPFEKSGKWSFPKRNRIITGLSSQVLIMEAPTKSGAMSSAYSAISQNRELTINDHPDMTQNSGGRKLLEEGCRPLIWNEWGIPDPNFFGIGSTSSMYRGILHEFIR